MAGLFDMLGFAPSTQKSIGGFLEMLQGMQSPDNPFRRAREDKQRNDMMQQEREWLNQQRQRQMQEWQQQDQMRSLPGQFMKPAQMPATMDNRDVGLPGEAPIGKQFDLQGYIEALKGIDPIKALQLEASLRKSEPDPLVLGPGSMAIDPRTGKPIAQAPFKPDTDKSSPLGQLITEMNALPPGDPRRAIYQQAITKQTTHSPGVNVTSYGAPTPVLNPKTGEVELYRPDNRGGMTPTGLKPPPDKGSEKPPTEFQSKAALYFKSMKTASQTLDDIERKGSWRPAMTELIAPGDVGRSVVQTESRQKYTQAQKQWIDSINRVRSGANLPELEYERAVATFFPIYGEGESIRAQKAAARRQEEEAMAVAAGNALKSNAASSNTLRFDAQGNPVN